MEVELKDTLNKQWKDDKSGFGFRMMQKMGWKEDKGLGKDESGIVDNIKISKREVGLGLGTTDTVDNANRGWSATASSFNDVLAVLKESFQKKDKKKKAKVSKSSTATISVGMKYKKFREAKDLSTKTDAEKRAIFGASMPALSASSRSASTTNSAMSSEPDCSSSSDEAVKKSKKAKKDKKEKKEKKSKKTE